MSGAYSSMLTCIASAIAAVCTLRFLLMAPKANMVARTTDIPNCRSACGPFPSYGAKGQYGGMDNHAWLSICMWPVSYFRAPKANMVAWTTIPGYRSACGPGQLPLQLRPAAAARPAPARMQRQSPPPGMRTAAPAPQCSHPPAGAQDYTYYTFYMIEFTSLHRP